VLNPHWPLATDHLSSAIGKARSLKSRTTAPDAATRRECGSAGARPHGRSQIEFRWHCVGLRILGSDLMFGFSKKEIMLENHLADHCGGMS
jgi:hypothetical protein